MWLGGGDFWRAAIKAAMFLTTDNATAQVSGRTATRVSSRTMLNSMIELDDFENSFAALPARAGYSRKSQTTPSLLAGPGVPHCRHEFSV